ncbi:hypothetical protein B0H67DRAFT_613185 [Lasiosphaeris hirsuta]|uniref:Uncharacterized protein n=1 Tax=Lasiosphaeris hirsuta TaxID=260670 RepID=A0AA40DI98_9PEZI|nr:hypothetical protein B0H67DRAFT_613185 [Lasiosphaeris hirsuta]
MAPEQRQPSQPLKSLFLQLKEERETEHAAMYLVFDAMITALDVGLAKIPAGKAYERFYGPVYLTVQETLKKLATGQNPQSPEGQPRTRPSPLLEPAVPQPRGRSTALHDQLRRLANAISVLLRGLGPRPYPVGRRRLGGPRLRRRCT